MDGDHLEDDILRFAYRKKILRDPLYILDLSTLHLELYPLPLTLYPYPTEQTGNWPGLLSLPTLD